MEGISTLTQKGQIAIPKAIRDHFQLTSSSKIRFTVENGKIIGEPVPSVSQMMGIVKTKKHFSKAEEKNAIKKRILRKHEGNT